MYVIFWAAHVIYSICFRTILQLTLSVIIDLTILPHLNNAPGAPSILKTYITFIEYNQFYTNHVVQGNEM